MQKKTTFYYTSANGEMEQQKSEKGDNTLTASNFLATCCKRFLFFMLFHTCDITGYTCVIN